MNEILRDTSWQFIITSIIAVLAIIAAFVIYFLQRSKKSLSYEIVSSTSLLTTSEEIQDKIQILYEDKPVKNVHLLVVKVTNDGRQPIDDKDFKKPLDFVFDEEAQVLSAEPISVKPDNLKVVTTFEANKFTIAPIMLNSKDFIEIKAIVSTHEIEFEPDARIVGVNKINQQADLSSLKITLFFWTALIISIIYIILLYFFANRWINAALDLNLSFITFIASLILSYSVPIALFYFTILFIIKKLRD